MADALHVFTCAAVNYLPKVRVLCRSVRRYHPEAVIHLALADVRPPWLTPAGEPFDHIIEMDALGIPDWRPWAFRHTLVELSTAIKPFALQRLLAEPGCRTVWYFDPDVVLFSRLDDILDVLGTSNLALTPHQTQPERTVEAIVDNEVASLRRGIFNLGFIGVANTAEGRRFAAWWGERTLHFCRDEEANGLFTDQKWLNFAPVFFDGVAILKASRHNVATWNLTTRRLTGDLESGLRVDGEPLGFYHFTGFDSGGHAIMAARNAAGSPVVQALLSWYEREVSAADTNAAGRWPWAFGVFADGTPVEPLHRWLYRTDTEVRTRFPDPWAARSGGRTFLDWCRTEGPVRYHQLVAGAGAFDASRPPALPSRVPSGSMTGLVELLVSPRRGRTLRKRLYRVLRSEGLRGLFRRWPQRT